MCVYSTSPAYRKMQRYVSRHSLSVHRETDAGPRENKLSRSRTPFGRRRKVRALSCFYQQGPRMFSKCCSMWCCPSQISYAEYFASRGACGFVHPACRVVLHKWTCSYVRVCCWKDADIPTVSGFGPTKRAAPETNPEASGRNRFRPAEILLPPILRSQMPFALCRINVGTKEFQLARIRMAYLENGSKHAVTSFPQLVRRNVRGARARPCGTSRLAAPTSTLCVLSDLGQWPNKGPFPHHRHTEHQGEPAMAMECLWRKSAVGTLPRHAPEQSISTMSLGTSTNWYTKRCPSTLARMPRW